MLPRLHGAHIAPVAQTMYTHRCPRCQHPDIHGRRQTFGCSMEPGGTSRTIEEFFCPQCELFEVADSDQLTYIEVLLRWRKTDLPMPME